MNVGIVGTGYWGKNLVRNFASIGRARLHTVCDQDAEALARIVNQYPAVRTTRDFDAVLKDSEIDAVVIATPAVTHFELAKEALLAGKHVFVEKPLCLESVQAGELVALSRREGRILMVGHLLEFHPGVTWIKEHLDELGDIYYLYSQRLNLGIVRKDESAWWSLAPHDVSIILYLLDAVPETVSARGASYLRPGVEDVVFATLSFADGKMAQIQVSWLDPHKIRKLTLVGERKMVTFDDMEAAEKIKVFDKGAYRELVDGGYGDHITIRLGDIYLPRIDMVEPLRVECEHFVTSCLEGREPRTGGEDGLRVVQVLEAAERSIRSGGVPVRLDPVAV